MYKNVTVAAEQRGTHILTSNNVWIRNLATHHIQTMAEY